MKAEESILIERLKKGERTAFNELYGIFWAPLVNYAELIVGDENADDVVQEVFVRIWVGRDKLRILVVGLVIFLLSGIACLFIRNITALILVSCILGIGAGMIIPLSTGLVVAYFTGEYLSLIHI